MTEEERCRHTALERLEDAFALYKAARYSATLYMCGYVIELGIKAEFHKLANTSLSSVQSYAGTIINQLFKGYSEKEKNECVSNAKFPTTIKEYAKLISDVASSRENAGKPIVPKKLPNFYLIENNQFASSSDLDDSSKKKSEKKDENLSVSKFHNITGFLETLNEWRIAIGEKDFKVDDYKIDALLGWGTYLRYGEPSPNNKEVEQSDSMNALEMAINFLRHVVLVDVSEFESQLDEILNPNNEPSPDNMGGD